MASTTKQKDVSSDLSNLSLGTKKTALKKEPVADSWEDEDVTDTEPEPSKAAAEAEVEAETESISASKQPGSAAPPPTPVGDSWSATTTPRRSESLATDPDKRPEKTDAVARRMIAAGLGLKAPKQTEEQKAYQRSLREQEKKRREMEKAEEQKKKEEVEKAKAAVWED